MNHFVFSSKLPFSAQDVLAWHQRKGASIRCQPPWDVSDSLLQGCEQHIVSQAEDCSIVTEENKSSRDCNEELIRLFSWRHAALNEDLKLFHRYPQTSLRILLSGSNGFIGSHFKALLEGAGHTVIPLLRGPLVKSETAVYWDPNQGILCKDHFEDFDAVVHLAGESLSNGRWNKKRKEKIFLSRCRDTWLLSQVLCRLYRPPPILIAASAIGFYGDRGQEELTEESRPGNGFLSDLCCKWERATDAIEQRGTRVVHPRFGMVLSRRAGALAKMLMPYKLGLGGRLGSGEQIISWIAIDDAIGALYHMLMEETLFGPVNLVSPTPLAQKLFAEILAKRLHRIAWMPLPKLLLRLIYRDLADEVLLASSCVKPKKLLDSSYLFRHTDLTTALHSVM